ncbi:trypsin-like peptidase domain-containing protein [Streptomyces sp. WMMC500]|uniref:VMAP-C domain-containing protein n=1 Tax=Streptomyces sp. WMMC500 TaxID=3015154 RepID=UPI00248BB37D|nr:trypsin-like peptidase domain-containing protein [Streptomyces sp. WMMC500]WBB63171.1 trypsin-like peptidase domain-containing protein [Streptomyces sp. WMMC500]
MRVPIESSEGADYARYQLCKLAAAATVDIRAAPGSDDGSLWGSGFLVAPEWVLTCAHVFVHPDGWRRGTAPGELIGVVVGGRTVPGRVEYSMPSPDGTAARMGRDPEVRDETFAEAVMQVGPDLALVRLLPARADATRAAAGASESPRGEAQYGFPYAALHAAQIGVQPGARADARPGAPSGPERGTPARPPAGSEPVWLGDRYDDFLDQAVLLSAHGRAAAGNGDEVEAALLSAEFAGRNGQQILLGTPTPIRKGASGGPVLHLGRGEVVGVVKARYRSGTGGGTAVSLDELRALSPEHLLPGAEGLGPEPYRELMRLHDAWHWHRHHGIDDERTSWTDLQRALGPPRYGAWGALDRLSALYRLADLPAPRDPEVVERLVHHVLDIQGRPLGARRLRDWRDGHGLLHRQAAPERALRDMLLYLKLVAREAAADIGAGPGAGSAAGDGAAARTAVESLEAWVAERSGELTPRQRREIRAVRRAPVSVLVTFDKLPFLDPAAPSVPRYNWTVRRGYGKGEWEHVALDQSYAGGSFEEAEEQVLAALAPQLLGADAEAQTRVRLEVALPEERQAQPTYRWELPVSGRATAARPPAGTVRPVVHRDAARAGPEPEPLWRDRWRRMSRAPRQRLVRAEPPGWGREAGDGGVPVFCHALGGGRAAVVGQLLDEGTAVALWRAGGHEGDECGAECAAYHEELAALLTDGAGTVVRDLPERLHEVRREALEAGRGCAADVILLYDDADDAIGAGG